LKLIVIADNTCLYCMCACVIQHCTFVTRWMFWEYAQPGIGEKVLFLSRQRI